MMIFPNSVMAACDWIRGQLPAGQPWSDALVTKHWDDTVNTDTPWAVIVRNDGGSDTSPISQNIALGVTCFGPRLGTEPDEIACERLAQHVAAILRDCAQPGPVNPFAGCTDLNGPYPVPSDTGRPCYYLTCGLEVVANLF